MARIAGDTLDAVEARGIELDGTFADQIDARLAVLAERGQLEAKGDTKRWGYSEVRLPGGGEEAAE